jgi:hypothetical protein
MNVLDPLPRADFLALIKRDAAAFRDHRHLGHPGRHLRLRFRSAEYRARSGTGAGYFY